MMLKKGIGISAFLLFSLSFSVTSNLLAFTYEVGPGMPFENIGDVPLENLSPGDTVRIHYRTDPYCEKWVIARSGTASENIVFQGVPGPGDELPVIDGREAITRLELDYWSEERGVINLGGSSFPNQDPDYVVIENLEIRSGRSPFTFTDDSDQPGNYSSNAASIYIVSGDHITIRNCILHDCGNGFFASHQSGNITVEYCYIYGNGIEGSYYQHNNYTESNGIVFQYNHFGPLRADCDGNNLKDRSCGTVIRYNWIECGNRQLDLVDSSHPEIYNDPSYAETFVYGNVLIEQYNEGNSQICHYGGDSSSPELYRKGTLHFYNNTVISKRTGNTTLFRLSTNDEYADARNNIVYVTDSGDKLALLNVHGILDIRNNWFKPGWVESHQGGFIGTVINSGGIVTGEFPGFVDWEEEDFHLTINSSCVDAGTSLNPDVLPEHDVINQYVKHCQSEERPCDGYFDIGAFEYGDTGIMEEAGEPGIPYLPYVYKEGDFIVFEKMKTGNEIRIYDISGKLIHNSGEISSDTYTWNMDNVSEGLYLYFIKGTGTVTGKFIIVN